ncbi:MAG: NrfD/PsrC family molybdoenzyme membrane anchor subunit [Pseudomonadota bacterium]
MAKIAFQKLEDHSPFFWGLLGLHAAVIALALGAAYYMEHHGHVVTGMNNRIVWGLPHVFAVFLIVSASGALNLASVSSVFNKLTYKPYARLSGILAIALLVGGLAVLVLDLGRPDRLIVAMTTYNFKSIFAWNIYLYTGFIAIVAAYLFAMMDRRASQNASLIKGMGWLAFVWRLVLTTGTGSIFGFLVARDTMSGAVMAPLFIAASFLWGLAFTVLVLVTVCRAMRQQLMTEEMVATVKNLLFIFALATLYFTVIQHITKIYWAEHRDAERFMLLEGGIYTTLFWLGQILIGTLLPMALLTFAGEKDSRNVIVVASVLFLIGGLAFMYVTIIGGQAYPMRLFPGMIESSSFLDGQVAPYTPTLPELLLGLGGISIAMLATGIALKLMPFLPVGPRAVAGQTSAHGAAHGAAVPAE